MSIGTFLRLPDLDSLKRVFLDTPVFEFFTTLFSLIQRFLPLRSSNSLYEVLTHDVQLELLDSGGNLARYTKYQKVKFLQNNVIAYQDQAWGDGDIFAEYKCAPGVPVDRYREGHRYRILISLRATKNRGDVEEFHIERTIKNGFQRDVEEFQTQVEHPTHALKMRVIFPVGRLPKHITLFEQNVKRTMALSADHLTTLPDNRQQVTWEATKPRLFEAYIIRWQW